MIRCSLTNFAQEQGFDDRFHIHSEFMDTSEFRERLYTFDIGFAHTSPKIVSNSGAAADMVSCGVPVIVNDVPHFSHIKPYVVVKADLKEMIMEVINIHKKGQPHLDVLRKKALEAVPAIGYSKMAQKHVEIYNRAIAEFGPSTTKQLVGVVEDRRRFLNKDNFITVTCPNSVWQILLLWRKLSTLAKEGYSFRFVVQNTGMMEPSILSFVLEDIVEVHYADVGMDDDPRVARIHSRSLAQNMTTDIVRWLKDGKSFADLFGFIEEDSNPYVMNLGEFAVNRAKVVIPDPTDVALINVDDEPMLFRATTILQNTAREGIVFKKLIIMGKPTTERYARALYEKIVVGTSIDDVKVVIEDTRTRWALCDRAHTVITGWDDVAAYCLNNSINAVYDCRKEWQDKLVDELMKTGVRTSKFMAWDEPVTRR